LSVPLKLYFDACCSKSIPIELKVFFKDEFPDLETKHVLDRYPQSTDDSVWLADLREDRSWIVVTCDRGCDKSKERLPVICREWNITHILFTPALLKMGKLAQKQALVTVWRDIVRLHELRAGTLLKLGCHQRSGISTYALRLANGKMLRFDS
jgi:hypothetical protein